MDCDFTRRHNSVVLFLALALLFTSSLAFGQGIVTGSISGTVEDEQGALVSGAQVQATQITTNRTFNTASSNGGVVLVPSLPPGTYKVDIQAQGFAAYTAGSVQVLVGKNTSLGRVRLKVGPTTETLTVRT